MEGILNPQAYDEGWDDCKEFYMEKLIQCRDTVFRQDEELNQLTEKIAELDQAIVRHLKSTSELERIAKQEFRYLTKVKKERDKLLAPEYIGRMYDALKIQHAEAVKGYKIWKDKYEALNNDIQSPTVVL